MIHLEKSNNAPNECARSVKKKKMHLVILKNDVIYHGNTPLFK